MKELLILLAISLLSCGCAPPDDPLYRRSCLQALANASFPADSIKVLEAKVPGTRYSLTCQQVLADTLVERP